MTTTTTVQVKGCLGVDYYEYYVSKNVKIPIYIFGEEHTLEGNSNSILNTIYSNTNCPIDVLIETFFTDKGNILHTSEGNVAQLITKYERCMNKSSVIAQHQFKQSIRNSDFYKTCIVPFKGRVKFWAVDVRLHFSTLSKAITDYIKELKDRQIYNKIKQSRKHFLNVEVFFGEGVSP